MPTLTATVTTTKDIVLKPALRRKLMTELRAYAAIKDQIAILEHAKDKHKAVIGALRDDTGEQSIALEGFKVTLVAPVRSVLNKQKLIALGCAAAWLEEATEQKPGRAYNKITLPGETNEEGD